MRLSDILTLRFAKWSLIGVAVALVADLVASQAEILIIAARDAGLVLPVLAFVAEGALLVVLTILALLLIGERDWTAVLASCVATVVGYLIGAVHLAALSLGVSVITLGERVERTRTPPPVSPAPVRPRGSRTSNRRRRSRRR
jgi:hypothetical protein